MMGIIGDTIKLALTNPITVSLLDIQGLGDLIDMNFDLFMNQEDFPRKLDILIDRHFIIFMERENDLIW